MALCRIVKVEWFCLGSGPVCTSTPDSLFCQADFMGCEFIDIKPIMTWKDDSGIIVKSETPSQSSPVDGAPRLQRSISEFPISDNDNKLYECQLTFSKPPSDIDPRLAHNAPDFSASCHITSKQATGVLA